MSVKLLMTWDISPERESEYFEFVIGQFIPGVQRMGLEPIEAWATIYGEYPQIQVAMLAPDLPNAQRTLNSSEWTSLRDQLFDYVKNYSYKLIQAKGGFQF
ncbi:MAG TPA: hypothetical protein DCG54_10205 [Anaerolineae bacterium]|jgi:hypothetical protein|nr:hypothetical protein [Anaerolineae bacterium]HAE59851.1 hypothetical protein [Anaerolineae bacterium]